MEMIIGYDGEESPESLFNCDASLIKLVFIKSERSKKSLFFTENSLCYVSENLEFSPLSWDMNKYINQWKNFGGIDLFSRVIGTKKDKNIKVLDASAGTGKDLSLSLYLGATVYACERNPIVYLLLFDAIRRLADINLRNKVFLRFGTAEEVAKTVAFLTSDGASYITGEVISINGGLYT